MTGMLEKACVAIAVNELRERGGSSFICEMMVHDESVRASALETYASTVRAVLMAIREPDAVCVIDACVKTVDANGHAHPPAMFTAMIDAILNETPE